MTESTHIIDGSCTLLPVDLREYELLRELRTAVEVSGEPQSELVKEIVKRLREEWP